MLVLFGDDIAPHDPQLRNLRNRLLPLSLDHPLGTDAMGRDILSRLMAAFTVTPVAAFVTVGLSSLIGTAYGFVAAMVSRPLSSMMMRFVDGVLSLPLIAVALVASSIFGVGLYSIVTALVLLHWADYARVVRSALAAEMSRTYVLAAQALGVPPLRLAMTHLVPAMTGALLVLASHSLAVTILTFAGLSFIGLGAEPGSPEFGLMVAESRDHMRSSPHLMILPGLAVFGLVLMFNRFADTLSDRDPLAGPFRTPSSRKRRI
ncbi:ABC transporter permease subunit [Aquicoccus sp. SU-CL01552]|uniref:ABC transporter permease n=1 Tax=Aquicoccus sp. SU-CL01552 TaxID=3127656 RepID=UPI003340E8CD